MSIPDCDFIPADYHEAQSLQRAVKLRCAFVGILIVIMALWVVAHQHQLARAEAMVVDIGKQQQQLAIHLAKKESMEAERARLKSRQQLIEQLGRHASLVVVFADISRRLPEAVVLTEMSIHCPSLPIHVPRPQREEARPRLKPVSSTKVAESVQPANRPNRAQVFMTGIASSTPEVIEFAASLESSPLIDQVQMEVKGPVTWAGVKAQKFELTCNLVAQRGTPS